MPKSGRRVLVKSGLPWEHNFYSHRFIARRTIILPRKKDEKNENITDESVTAFNCTRNRHKRAFYAL